jgi:hypothetical protein
VATWNQNTKRKPSRHSAILLPLNSSLRPVETAALQNFRFGKIRLFSGKSFCKDKAPVSAFASTLAGSYRPGVSSSSRQSEVTG